MRCPHCQSENTRKYTETTSLGYAIFRCHGYGRRFNERTGTPFNNLQFPTDVVLLVVVWRLRYKFSLRDLSEMFLIRGYSFTHEAVREWEERFAPVLSGQLKAKRRGHAGKSWYVDETYLKVAGQWCYLYRAVDRDGNLVDTLLSPTRDLNAARAFFKQAITTVGHRPECITTDKHSSYPRAIRQTAGRKVLHRTSQDLNNRIEQSHRGIKDRYYPMRGFGSLLSAARFCTAFDEVRQHFRSPSTPQNSISLAEQRTRFRQQFDSLMVLGIHF